jgi:hypothetical protein
VTVVRPAQPSEAAGLTELIMRSKAEQFYLRMGAVRIGDTVSTASLLRATF